MLRTKQINNMTENGLWKDQTYMIYQGRVRTWILIMIMIMTDYDYDLDYDCDHPIVIQVRARFYTTSGVFRITKWGAKFLLATSIHTKEGANQVFQFFFNVKKMFLAKRGAMAQWPPPPKYAFVHNRPVKIQVRELLPIWTVL